MSPEDQLAIDFTLAVKAHDATLALVLGEMQELRRELEELRAGLPGRRLERVEKLLATNLNIDVGATVSESDRPGLEGGISLLGRLAAAGRPARAVAA